MGFRLYRLCHLNRPLSHLMSDIDRFQLLQDQPCADVGGMGTSASAGVSRLDKNKTSTLSGWPTDPRPTAPVIDRDFHFETERTDVARMVKQEESWRRDPKATSTEAPDDRSRMNDAVEATPMSAPDSVLSESSQVEHQAIANRAVIVFALSTLFWAPVAFAVNWLC